jgi:hypothetical protein
MFLLLISLSFAQEQQKVYKKETEIDFEALDIEGELVKPQGLFLTGMQDISFNPLIELRYDWDDEMNDSVREIK